MRKSFFITCILFVLMVSCYQNRKNVFFAQTSVDSLEQMIASDPLHYKDSLPKIVDLIAEQFPDSLKSTSVSKIAYSFFNSGDLDSYYHLSHKSLQFAIISKDSLQISIVYNDISDYHSYGLVYDSAFYYINKAISYAPIRNSENLSRYFLNRASIQFFQNSLVEAEIDAINALRYSDEVQDKLLEYEINNLLGAIFQRLKDYKTSLKYYQASLELVDGFGDDDRQFIYYAVTYNNLGYMHLLNNDYYEAQKLLTKGLEIKNLESEDPNRYASLLDNFAYSRLKTSRLENVENDFFKALSLRKLTKNTFGQIVSLRRIGEYYQQIKDTSQAIHYIQSSLDLAKTTDTYNEVLLALDLLAQLQPDKREVHLVDYIRISDSLHQAERNVRDKFLRIAYETDRVVKERDSLLRERQYAIAGIVGLVTLIGLLILVFRLQIRQKQLLFKQKEQQINQEFYMQLVERAGEVEKARLDEKNRVSKELHDGVLSAVVSVRLQLVSQLKDARLPEVVENQIKKLGEIEKDIRLLSHDLRSNSKLTQESFPKLIQEWCIEFEETRGIAVHCELDAKIDWFDVPVTHKIHIYRIIQEAFQNIYKYAEASFAQLEINLEDDGIHFLIYDDGIGFDVEKKRKGIGIKNMNERAAEMNAQIQVLSNPGNGTSITFVLPL